MDIDHKNRNPLDDRIENLREVTISQNMCNRGITKTGKENSKYKGVYWKKSTRKWEAKIGVNGKYINLGSCHDNPEEAYEAYLEAAKKYHGEFACSG